MDAPIFILAGEPSGDQLAARMMRAVEVAYGNQQWIGVGGEAMAANGLESWVDMEQLSIIGFGAALRAYPKLSALMNRLVDQICAARPKLVMTVDAKGFSLRLAARLKKRMKQQGWQAPIVHTVAPTVWAWGEWRKHAVAKSVDCLLCLFPFEPDYFVPTGLRCAFIGHPDADNTALTPMPVTGPSDEILLLPGSRRSEITRILPPMLAASRIIMAKRPDVKVSLATVPYMASLVERIIDAHEDGHEDGHEEGHDGRPVTVTTERSQFYDSVKRADAVLAASGTVTLQTALMGAPGIATYIAGGFSAGIGRRLVAMDKVILPNAVLGRDVYPFLFQEQASAINMSQGVLDILDNPKAKDEARATATELRRKLGGDTGFDARVTTALQPYF